MLTGARKEVEEVGRARKFDAFSDGGGISDDAPGRAGGAMSPGAAGGVIIFGWPDALCAELRAGKDGGGSLSSSSSSSSELSCSANVNVGIDSLTTETLGLDGTAFGVVCGEGSALPEGSDGDAGRSVFSRGICDSVGLSVAVESTCFLQPAENVDESHAVHVDGGWW